MNSTSFERVTHITISNYFFTCFFRLRLVTNLFTDVIYQLLLVTYFFRGFIYYLLLVTFFLGCHYLLNYS
jgi:hypothetical protein